MDPSPVYANIEKECNFNLHTLKSAKNVDEILEKQTIALKEADRSAAFYHFNLSREKAEELLFRKCWFISFIFFNDYKINYVVLKS